MTTFNSFAVELDVIADNKFDVPRDIVEYCEANNVGLFVAVRKDVDNLPIVFTASSRDDLVQMINTVYEKEDREQQEFFATMIKAF
ncbi:hypothetical protein YOLOSWAG_248 [Erwinia phage vB_EamM_Yoloswag]|uniref:Uncharacterized protein n=1 Tax=Erwinia phage vB_EamM_Yoloswag TaxID=1958956 RepID=A0A1S6L3H0_9CAUD|nr:hypothetical protein HOR66_gp248 [Erwinia phage vB_EamM_Yoloswag]AQT28722.1 hypothetical protein YOLOSWAG_248 [Erwinia phage vB_EamM_Yoloswag]